MREAEKSKLGQPGPYAVPDHILKEEVMRLARAHGVPTEYLPEVMAVAEKNIRNEILKAAGSPVTADDENVLVELWVIAREIGVEKEYNEDTITPGAFLRLVKRHYQPQRAKEIVLDPAPRRTKKRGAKPSPGLEKARKGLRPILLETKFAEADTAAIISEAGKRGVFCPYGPNWDYALTKHYSAVYSLISREKDHLHNLQN
jgi:hypothetical protein